MKEYGQPDEDTAPYSRLLDHIAERYPTLSIQYVLHNQRVPIDARPCQLPLSLRVQAVLSNGQIITAFQAKPQAVVQIQE